MRRCADADAGIGDVGFAASLYREMDRSVDDGRPCLRSARPVAFVRPAPLGLGPPEWPGGAGLAPEKSQDQDRIRPFDLAAVVDVSKTPIEGQLTLPETRGAPPSS